jgi:hypothetical protein
LPKNIYLLSHSKQRNETLVENTDGNQIGIMEEGVFTAFANLFRDRGDELRAQLRSMGIEKDRAAQLEEELDKGRIVIIAKHDDSLFDPMNPDKNVLYHPFLPYTSGMGVGSGVRGF